MHALAVLLTLWTTPSSGGAASGPIAEPDANPSPLMMDRIEALWLDAAGTSGRLTTIPMFLDGEPGDFHFGPRFCGRSHGLGEHTLRALQGALASGQPVRVDAEVFGTGEQAKRRCITGVSFFAPIG